MEVLRGYWSEFVTRGDPRTNPMWLISDPCPVLGIIAVYICLVVVGPRFMKNKEPLQCRSLLIIYNLCHVQLSMWMGKPSCCCLV